MVENRRAAGYLRAAERIKQYIRDHELPVGGIVPPRSELEQILNERPGIVRQAVDRLKNEGILTGEQGRAGYEITRLPDGPDPLTASDMILRQLVAELRDEVTRLAEEVGELRRELRERCA